ncbi:PREDICTED: uncharacterized protein LOC104819587 isoform X2 [Tarenaya hassleriana]|uniref:uncharacterized protein LOC104819587 isoform X1 n=1 Tax=Tarenaya hassleriana TaxID=28532 RepID=UPI00053C30D0|nr:PREDICTED: uncharacterized protein LOC104819587 isoform X1 [Tarenaya hassleriana]XP_010548030.1 PREDICTED: uncharacterized protein LOC104819587 isoform X2 [Tarenaya hassleriana]
MEIDSTTSSPYITAPSSPTRFGITSFTSPPSPSNSSSFRSSNAPFDESSRKRSSASDFSEDFEFDFSGQLEKGSFSAADELFHGGKIRPLRPPPGYEHEHASEISSPRSKDLKKDGFDLFQKEVESSNQKQRGRDRSQGLSSSGFVHKGSRSLSPLRVSDIMLEEEDENSSLQPTRFVSCAASNRKTSVSSAIFSAFSFPGRAYKKWKLKDLLLFRSASEGRPVPTKDSLNRYEILSKKEVEEEAKNSSFRSTESAGSSASRSSWSRPRSQPAVSAHELHYTANRAVSEEMKRKTFLPYKQGWLGCLGFNPGVHNISRVGSLTRGGS